MAPFFVEKVKRLNSIKWWLFNQLMGIIRGVWGNKNYTSSKWLLAKAALHHLKASIYV